MKLPIINRDIDQPIRRQIYEQIRHQILCGEMKSGETLLSTRQLADALGLARSTVVEAYDMLLAEGYLTSRQGAQTVVADGVVIDSEVLPKLKQQTKRYPRIVADFSTGRPDLTQFPKKQWALLLSSAALELPISQYGYAGPQGYLPLRSEIASWLSRSRGIAVDADDIFITAGATHALHIITQLLCPNKGRVIVEDPCHNGLYDALVNESCEIIPIEADEHGLRTELLNGKEKAGMIYVTPSHQFPLGGILPASRRAALIRYARENNVYIVEDDYDSEFRYAGEPIAPIYSMDSQRVVYVGTFSKSLFPALRIGFVILPKQLQSRWKNLRTHIDVLNTPIEQAALASFLQTRKFDRYVRSMKKRYSKRRQVLLNALNKEFNGECFACGDAAGLHVTIRFFGKQFATPFLEECSKRGVLATPLENYCIVKGSHTDQLVLGYGHLEPEQIEFGVQLLSEIIRKSGQ